MIDQNNTTYCVIMLSYCINLCFYRGIFYHFLFSPFFQFFKYFFTVTFLSINFLFKSRYNNITNCSIKIIEKVSISLDFLTSQIPSFFSLFDIFDIKHSLTTQTPNFLLHFLSLSISLSLVDFNLRLKKCVSCIPYLLKYFYKNHHLTSSQLISILFFSSPR